MDIQFTLVDDSVSPDDDVHLCILEKNGNRWYEVIEHFHGGWISDLDEDDDIRIIAYCKLPKANQIEL
jgi:hypothetical protein